MLCGFTGETIAIKQVIDLEMPFSHEYDVATGSLMIPAPSPSGRVLQDYTLLASEPEQVAGINIRGGSMESTLADGDWVLDDPASRDIRRERDFLVTVSGAPSACSAWPAGRCN